MQHRVRTRLEMEANDFDARLFHLLERAREFAISKRLRMNKRERENWAEVHYALKNARPFLREMMHKDDVAETV